MRPCACLCVCVHPGPVARASRQPLPSAVDWCPPGLCPRCRDLLSFSPACSSLRPCPPSPRPFAGWAAAVAPGRPVPAQLRGADGTLGPSLQDGRDPCREWPRGASAAAHRHHRHPAVLQVGARKAAHCLLPRLPWPPGRLLLGRPSPRPLTGGCGVAQVIPPSGFVPGTPEDPFCRQVKAGKRHRVRAGGVACRAPAQRCLLSPSAQCWARWSGMGSWPRSAVSSARSWGPQKRTHYWGPAMWSYASGAQPEEQTPQPCRGLNPG